MVIHTCLLALYLKVNVLVLYSASLHFFVVAVFVLSALFFFSSDDDVWACFFFLSGLLERPHDVDGDLGFPVLLFLPLIFGPRCDDRERCP